MRRTAVLAATLGVVLVAAPAAHAGAIVSTPITGLASPTDVASADFDGNGRADLAIAQSHGLVLSLNQGGGVFTNQALTQSGDPVNVATGDLDRDGKPDVATVSTTQRIVDLNIQDGAGDWDRVVLADVGVKPVGIAIGDLNGDGWGDIAVNDAGLDANGDYNLHLLVKNALTGDYDETTLTNFHDTGHAGPLAVAIGDLDGDGRPDLVTANGDNATLSLFTRQAAGGYAQRFLAVPGGHGAAAVAVGDLGGSGAGADLAVAFGASAVDSVGVFLRYGGEPSGYRGSIVNGVAGRGASLDTITIFRLGGSPAFAASDGVHRGVTVWSGGPEIFDAAEAVKGIATGDFDGDGRTDVATLEPSSGKGVLITAIRPDTVGVCGCVPETLALFTHANASFGTFIPGITKDYTATTTSSVIATGQRAALSVSEPGYLSSGAATLRSPLAVEFSKSAWTEPVAYDPVTITLKQHIDANETLRAGTYSRTLTFTLSATMP